MLIWAIKLLGAPLLIALASLAGKKHGHRVAGVISGLPVIGGPVILCVWLQNGADFAAQSSFAVPGGLFALAFHLYLFQRLAARRGWAVCLLAGWTAFVVVGLALTEARLPGIAAALLGLSSLCVLDLLLPRTSGGPLSLPSLGRAELGARMIAGLALVVAITELAAKAGPARTGLFTVFPVTGSVMPAFTLANAGPGALVTLLRGYLSGLFGLGVFFTVLAPLIAILSWWALIPATLACVLASYGFSAALQRVAPHAPEPVGGISRP